MEPPKACPTCGAGGPFIPTYTATGEGKLTFSGTAKGTLIRPLDALRLTVIGVLLAVGLTVGFGVGPLTEWYWGVVAGGGSPVLLAVLFRCRPTRNALSRAADAAIGPHRDGN
jgi:hypothetical protein